MIIGESCWSSTFSVQARVDPDYSLLYVAVALSIAPAAVRKQERQRRNSGIGKFYARVVACSILYLPTLHYCQRRGKAVEKRLATRISIFVGVPPTVKRVSLRPRPLLRARNSFWHPKWSPAVPLVPSYLFDVSRRMCYWCHKRHQSSRGSVLECARLLRPPRPPPQPHLGTRMAKAALL